MARTGNWTLAQKAKAAAETLTMLSEALDEEGFHSFDAFDAEGNLLRSPFSQTQEDWLALHKLYPLLAIFEKKYDMWNDWLCQEQRAYRKKTLSAESQL